MKARTKGETGAAKTLCAPFHQPDLEGTILLMTISMIIIGKKFSYYHRFHFSGNLHLIKQKKSSP